jgi:hypothetical protein
MVAWVCLKHTLLLNSTHVCGGVEGLEKKLVLVVGDSFGRLLEKESLRLASSKNRPAKLGKEIGVYLSEAGP